MCGRFVSASPAEEIAEYFAATAVVEQLDARYNVAPTSDVYVVHETGIAGGVAVDEAATRRLDAFHWGLIPSFAKDPKIGNRMINARAETVATNGAFKHSFARRRCIVPADGFYEWKAVADRKKKQPFFIHRVDDEQLAFAGLWAEWKGAVDGDPVVVRSTTIITTSANETMAAIHDRMPVILPARAWGEWLDPANHDVDHLRRLLVPAPASLLTMRAVSTEVSNARNEGAQLLAPIDPDALPGEGVQTTLL